jgi:hypothetical protein
MRGKKGYIYTLDVAVAAIILVVGLVVIIGMYFYVPDKPRTENLATDISGILSNTRVKDLCTACDCGDYDNVEAACPYATNDGMSLMELIGLLYSKGDYQKINDLIEEVIVNTDVLPETHGMQVVLKEEASGATRQLYPCP